MSNIHYIDHSYITKRKILNDFYNLDNSRLHIDRVAMKVYKKIKNPFIKSFLQYNIIVQFMVDGYIAFFKNGVQIDPNDLCLMCVSGAMVWQQWYRNIIIDYHKREDVLYFSWDNDLKKGYNSYLEPIYLGDTKIEDINEKKAIKIVYNTLMKNETEIANVLRMHNRNVVMRSLKLKKIHEKIQ